MLFDTKSCERMARAIDESTAAIMRVDKPETLASAMSRAAYNVIRGELEAVGSSTRIFWEIDYDERIAGFGVCDGRDTDIAGYVLSNVSVRVRGKPIFLDTKSGSRMLLDKLLGEIGNRV